MKILQLLPAPAGVNAVYVDIHEDSGLIVRPVHMFGIVELEGETLVDAFDYVYGDGYVPCQAQEDFIGIMNPGETVESFADAEALYRGEVVEKNKAAN